MRGLNRLGVVVSCIVALFLNTFLFGQTNNSCNYKLPLQASQWVFGDDVQLDFNIQPNVLNADAKELPSGVSSISDENGNLLFFSDGLKVWNSQMELVQNGNALKGNNLATQSSLIIPQPGYANQYILFTVDMYIPGFFTDGINYSIIKTSNNYSVVSSKNNLLMQENSQKITGTKHANGMDYWIMTHGFGPNKGGSFYCYLVDTAGVHLQPVTSQLGHPHEGGVNSNNGGGYMKFSPDGSKLALAITEDGVIEVYDFDTETGKLSNLRSSASGQFTYPFGIEFSPNGSLLYATTSPLGNNTNYLYQFDVTEPDPFVNPFVVEQFDVFDGINMPDSLLGALQLGIDGKIYVSKFRRQLLTNKYLGVINNPDRPTSACNYNHLSHMDNNGVYAQSGGILMGLPNFATNFLDIPHFYFLNQCHHDTTLIHIRNTANIDETVWEFNDQAGTQVNADPVSPGFVFSEPGTYQVDLTESYDGVDYLFSHSVLIHPLPSVEIGEGSDTIYILPNSSIRLDAGEYDYYTWLPDGSTNRYLDVVAEGSYSVTVTDFNCCTNSDQVYVKFAKLNYPNAFRPSSSVSENTTFKVIGQTSALANYRLQIYNRWGQLIFETEDPSEGWDGTQNGDPAPYGTYVWVSVFESFESGRQGSLVEDTRGTVVLLR